MAYFLFSGLDLAGVTEVGAQKCGSSSNNNSNSSSKVSSALARALQPLVDLQKDNNKKLTEIQTQLLRLNSHVVNARDPDAANTWLPPNRDLFIIALVLILQFMVMWFFK